MAGATVAVKVTDWLTDEGETEEATVVVVAVVPTVCIAVLVLPVKFVSPEV